MNKLLSLGLLISIALLSSACGWHLRGNIDVNGLQSVYVESKNPKGNFTKQLKRSLHVSGVSVEKSAPDAQYSLIIIDEESDSRNATVSSSARTAQRLIMETVIFMVVDRNGDELVPGDTLIAERLLDYDEGEVIGTNSETELIRSELRQQLIRQIISRLQYIKPATA